MYWSSDAFYGTPVFSQVMSRERFQIIMRFLHFQNNEDPNYNPQDPGRDRLFKIRPMIDMFQERFGNVYRPGEDLAVDESLVLFRGRLLFKQYIKSKRARFGIKFYELAMLHYPDVYQPCKPVILQQARVPNSLLMGVNYVDYEPQGTEVIQACLQTTP